LLVSSMPCRLQTCRLLTYCDKSPVSHLAFTSRLQVASQSYFSPVTKKSVTFLYATDSGTIINRVVLCLTGTSLLRNTSRIVRQASWNEGYEDFQARWVFVATWHNVSYYRNRQMVETLTLIH